MNKLTECKDCGHTVSKRAKVCPSCGVDKPGVAPVPTNFARLFVTALVIVVGGVVYLNYLNSIGDLSGSSGWTRPVATTATHTFTDAQIQEAIAKSDDYEMHRATFTKAATFLLTTSRCEQRELKEYGGFVKAQGAYKDQPIYFTYCGGMKIANRLYVDADTGKVFK